MRKILIIDDEPLMLDTLKRALVHFDASITTAKCGKDALLSSDRHTFDICITDIGLPDMSGFDIIKKVQETSPQTSFIIVSAMALDDDKRREIEQNGHLFVQKPFELTHIKNSVGELLKKMDASPTTPQGPWKTFKYTMERRRYTRRPFSMEISYSISNFSVFNQDKYSFTSKTLDICEKGIGILADHPITLGCVIRFDSFKPLFDHTAGIVTNVAPLENNSYRIGIEFV